MNKILDQKTIPGDEVETTLRPRFLKDYIGQNDIKEMLTVYITAAKEREEVLDHVLLYGPPGLGKTTLAHIIANEMNYGFKMTTGPALSRPGDLAAILMDLKPGDVLFIDEIHRLPRVIEEMLYQAMEDFTLDIVVGKDKSAEVLKINLSPFTLVGATTRFGDLTGPLRDRFGIVHDLKYYSEKELYDIIQRTSHILNYKIDSDASYELAKRSRGTPRIANRLFRRVRDFAQYHKCETINIEITKYALERLDIDELGLDSSDIKYLDCLINKFNGRPSGVETIASAIGEETITIEDVNEPYLLKEGFIIKTPRGRVATDKAIKHMNSRKEK